MINISQHSNYAGRYKLETRKGNVVTKSTGWFHNLLTDVGLDAFVGGYNGQGSPMVYSCQVGIGTSPPTFSDTALGNLVATTTASGFNGPTYVSGSTPYYRIIVTYSFGTGVAAGNLSEIGVKTGYGSLLSRALILDELGNPTTITVLSDEILVVTYELRQYIDTSDTAYSFPINGTTYSGVYRWFLIGQPINPSDFLGAGFNGSNVRISVYNGAIGAITSAPSGSVATAVASAPSGYTPGTRYSDTAATFAPTEANFTGGISAIAFSTLHHRLQFSVTPPIPKVLGQNLTLRIRYSWGRYP